MSIAKKKSLNILLAFTLVVSLFIPHIAFAYDTKGDPSNPTLTIHKFEQEPGAEKGEEGTGLPGQNADGEPVEGVEFTLTLKETFNPETNEWEAATEEKEIKGKTGENGQVVFTKAEGLELGRYEVQETDGPDHIILNPDVFKVDIPMTNKEGTELNYDVHIYPKNEIIRSDVELIKQDENGKPLEGVSFKLYNKDGSVAVDNEGKEIPELTTDEEGKISVTGLAQGEYYFQETKAPEGYAKNTTKIPFEVKKVNEDGQADPNGQKIIVEWKDVKGIADNGTVTNYIIPEIDKTSDDKKKLDVDRDAEIVYDLKITTPKDIDKYKALGVTDELDDRLTFFIDGTITGGWKVEGTDSANVTFKTKETTKGKQLLIWEIDPSKLTPGQELTISYTAKIKPDAELKPDEDGIPNSAKLHFNNNKGSYTDPADPDNPDPYEPYEPEDPDKPTDPENPTEPVDPSEPEEPVVVVPREGGMNIIKVEKGNHDNKLEGAEFKLTDEDGNVIDAAGTMIKVNGNYHDAKLENLVTDGNGQITIEGLTPGTYYLHETKAPIDKEDGKPYRLLTKPIEVKVENNKVTNKDVTVENSKSGWELPTTGGIGTILFTLIGLVLMITAFTLYVRRRQSEANAG